MHKWNKCYKDHFNLNNRIFSVTESKFLILKKTYLLKDNTFLMWYKYAICNYWQIIIVEELFNLWHTQSLYLFFF